MRWFVVFGALTIFAIVPVSGSDHADSANPDRESGGVVRDLSGTWRNTIVGVGVSYWELARKKDGTYDAREVGLGNRTGTARLKDGALVIRFEADGHTGVYTWPLKSSAGQGTYRQTFTDGQPPLKYQSTGRFIGK